MMFRAFSVLFPIFFTFCVTSHFASIYSIRSWFILILSCFSHRYKIYLLCQSRYLLSELQVQWQERRFQITKEMEMYLVSILHFQQKAETEFFGSQRKSLQVISVEIQI